MGERAREPARVSHFRPRPSRRLIAGGMALFYMHSAAHIFFLGWEGGGWKAGWYPKHTMVMPFIALVALLALNTERGTPLMLSKRAYGVGVATALSPLVVHASQIVDHAWGDVGALIWCTVALTWAFLPASVMGSLMWLEKRYRLQPTSVRLWDIVGGCLACVPLSGLPFWPLHRVMYARVPWLDQAKFQVDVWFEVSVAALLVIWAFVRMVLRDREELSS